MISMVQDMAGTLANQKFSQGSYKDYANKGSSTLASKGFDLGSLANPVPNLFGAGSSNTSIPGISLPNIGGSIGSGVDALVKNPTQTIGNQVLHDTGEMIRPFANYAGQQVKDPSSPSGQVNQVIGNIVDTMQPKPPPPKTPAELQADQYSEYQKKLPYMQSQIGEQLTQNANKDINKVQRQVEQGNSVRGMGYGALNEGMKANAAQQGQQQLAGQLASANQGLLDLGNQIQTGAIQTGIGNQGLLQQYQNSIYQQELVKQQANNKDASSLMGILGTAAVLAATAG